MRVTIAEAMEEASISRGIWGGMALPTDEAVLAEMPDGDNFLNYQDFTNVVWWRFWIRPIS